MTYSEQKNHPKWQRKRLEILERDGFKCTICGENEKSLHVHHLYYLPKTLIWEYDDEALKTVCEKHHNQLTYELGKLSGIIAFEILKGQFEL